MHLCLPIKDFNFRDLPLANIFENPYYVVSEIAGHHLPTDSDSTYDSIIYFIENLEFTTLEKTPTPTETPTIGTTTQVFRTGSILSCLKMSRK